MGAKDIVEKQLEDYNDVFSDVLNVLLFNGRQVVREDELENCKDKSMFKNDAKLHEQERDLSKYWKKNEIRLALFGYENQTETDKHMILRTLGYDGVSYRAQYRNDAIYPVITLVLSFNYKKHWDGPKSLYEMLDIPEGLEPFVNDYHLNVMEIPWLEEEQVAMFKSDFKIVADYFVQMRKNKGYNPTKDEIKHVDEILKMMKVLTGDDRFEITMSERKEVKNMCEVLDKVEARGEARGEAIGRVKALYFDAEFSVTEIAEKTGLSEDEIGEILGFNEKNN